MAPAEVEAAFGAVWEARTTVPPEVVMRLGELCDEAMQTYPTLDLDERALVTAIARHCPATEPLVYLARVGFVVDVSLTRLLATKLGEDAA